MQGSWHQLVSRPNIPPLPVWGKMVALNSYVTARLYGTTIPSLGVWEKGCFTLYLGKGEFERVTRTVAIRVQNNAWLEGHCKMLGKKCDLAKRAAERLEKKDLKEMNNLQLYLEYMDLFKKYSLSFVYGFLTWCSGQVQKDIQAILEKRTGILERHNLTVNDALAALLVYHERTAYQHKQELIAWLGKKHRKHGLSPKELEKGSEKISARYGWVGYDYIGPFTSKEEIIEAVLSWKPPQKKMVVLPRLGLSKEERQAIRAVRLLSFSKDYRNTTDDFVHYVMGKIYTEIASREGISAEEVRYLWPYEVKRLLLLNETPPKGTIKARMDYCSICNETGWDVYSGNPTESPKETKRTKQELASLEEIRGMPASTGRVKGKVRIVQTLDEMKAFQEGEILVTRMTSPRFMNAISKAAAIITDEGGLTCHAAIIARELQKPCIIGTQNATRMLETGDSVEVDAFKGIVKKAQTKG